MPDLCLSNNTCQIYSLLISELTLLCVNFVLSHPLYFSYFIFFSPYILKLLSFLSPLFITTSFLLLALLTTISPRFINCNSDQSNKVSILLSLYHAVLDMLKSYEGDGKIDEFDQLEDFEVYKMVFQETPFEFFDYTSPEESEKSVQEKDSATTTATVDLENTLEELLKEMDEFESKTWNVERNKIEALGTKVEKVVEKQKQEMIMTYGSKEMVTVDKVKKAHSWSNLDCNNTNNNNLGSYGSMRKEEEWTRTLACKLYEERHNASSGEGMDLLWETYELDSSGKSKVKRDNNTKKKNMKKKGESKRYEEDDEEDMNEQLCCLQALKFSAGKMNLGMGRPNLVKISKAIKGFGWLTKKNKVHCGDRF
ncbi:hypothetical protein RND71_013487 [Anisodus tanguticus]|uniref:Uncharacterized protein n=1 Tax=Anisodus tanguticus TaxID=243964 RepID=A0AAE1S9K0_9SOLA|nr:hypothetical protein RND71_013487 [Anisodus tanguticus]